MQIEADFIRSGWGVGGCAFANKRLEVSAHAHALHVEGPIFIPWHLLCLPKTL